MAQENAAYQKLFARVKALELENESLRNQLSTTKKKVEKVKLSEVSITQENGKDSLLKTARKSTVLRSTTILGKSVDGDKRLDQRVLFGQRASAVCSVAVVTLYIVASLLFGNGNFGIFVTRTIFWTFLFMSLMSVFYNNVSYPLARRLAKEVSVVTMLIFGVCIVTIDCAIPYNSYSPVNGCLYCGCVFVLCFLDTLKKRSRLFVLVIGIVFALVTLFCIFEYTFTDVDVGIILFKYSDDFVFRKRAVKRSLFVQIFLFSLNGLWTMFRDTKMELLMFAKGHIYRETGTSSKLKTIGLENRHARNFDMV